MKECKVIYIHMANDLQNEIQKYLNQGYELKAMVFIPVNAKYTVYLERNQ